MSSRPICLTLSGLALVGEGRAAADDKGASNPRQVRGQAVRHAVGEIFLLRIAADIGERQDDDGKARRFSRQFLRGRSHSMRGALPRLGLQRINPHRPRDVLQVPLAEIDEIGVDPAAHVVVGRARNQHAAGLANALQPRCDIDAVAQNVVALDQDIAEIDAHR